MKYLIIFFVFLVISCKSDPVLDKELKGDWLVLNHEPEIFSTCSFDGGYFSFPLANENFRYSMKDNKLKLFKLEVKNGILTGKKIIYHEFEIYKEGKDTLILQKISKINSPLDNPNRKNITLVKIEKKNSVHFERVGFKSTNCFGDCPMMYLEIDYLGNLFFDGRMNTKNDGIRRGRLSEFQLEKLQTKLNNIPLDSLKIDVKGCIDRPRYGLVIKTDKGFIKSVTCDNESALELKLFIHELIKMDEIMKLNKDSSIFNDFVLRKSMQELLYPMDMFPPPPTIAE